MTRKDSRRSTGATRFSRAELQREEKRMTTITAPNTQAWLAKDTISLGRFLVRLESDRVGFSTQGSCRWVLAVDAGGAQAGDPEL